MKLAAAAAALLYAGAAAGARPFVTDDARTVDPGGCQIESFYKSRSEGSEFWFLPACNPSRVELTAGYNRIESDRSLVLQAKTLLKPLETVGFAAAFGTFYSLESDQGSPFVNGIGSLALAGERIVLHANLGAIRDRLADVDRQTWGIGAEVLLAAPRLYGIVEAYGQRADPPTWHAGFRFWAVPNRLQFDATVGEQSTEPRLRFFSTGVRVLW